MKASTKPLSMGWFILRVLLIAVALISVHCVVSTEETFFYQGF